MNVAIKEIRSSDMNLYSQIPMQFTVKSKLEMKSINSGLGGIVLEEIPVTPYLKDFGLDESPLDWINDFDSDNWGFFIAYYDGNAVGGITLAYNTPNVFMLDGRTDLVVLWDIRVAPKYKGLKIGSQLFAEAKKWAGERNCTQIKIESQNNNTPACKFYVNQGCKLGEINKYAYHKDGNDDVKLVWYYDLV